jgi:hypothetical protein
MNKWLTMGQTPPSVTPATPPAWEKAANKEEVRNDLYLNFRLQLSLYREPFFSPAEIATYLKISKETVRRKIWELNKLAGTPIIELSHAHTEGYRTGTLRYYKLVKDWRAVFNATVLKRG